MENPAETAVRTSPADPLVPTEYPVRRTHSDGKRQLSGSWPTEWAMEADGYRCPTDPFRQALRLSYASFHCKIMILLSKRPFDEIETRLPSAAFNRPVGGRRQVEVAATSGGSEGGRFRGRSEGCRAAAEAGNSGRKGAAIAAPGGEQQAPGRPAALAMA
ncbi:hypothetical protein Cgig2_021460 [Carnegiea gigantea]|uniref:Uncharacterized protein n=1 Tax=Carnegiea gigantea TaxID=171969 RepID=A0A9Q1GKL2_9CARY|nr:hypothetical protein Cgig2_021460 [Carnegiea gigantea]